MRLRRGRFGSDGRTGQPSGKPMLTGVARTARSGRRAQRADGIATGRPASAHIEPARSNVCRLQGTTSKDPPSSAPRTGGPLSQGADKVPPTSQPYVLS